jgi:hypothetical protein
MLCTKNCHIVASITKFEQTTIFRDLRLTTLIKIQDTHRPIKLRDYIDQPLQFQVLEVLQGLFTHLKII